eukprot:2604300-Alexandrium_andersonii.AAC.1
MQDAARNGPWRLKMPLWGSPWPQHQCAGTAVVAAASPGLFDGGSRAQPPEQPPTGALSEAARCHPCSHRLAPPALGG